MHFLLWEEHTDINGKSQQTGNLKGKKTGCMGLDDNLTLSISS